MTPTPIDALRALDAAKRAYDDLDCLGSSDALFDAIADCQSALAVADPTDWRARAERDAAWNEGSDFVLMRLCECMGVDPSEVDWDGSDNGPEDEARSLLWRIMHHRDDDEGRSPEVARLETELTALRGKLAEAVGALRFYADPSRYKSHPHGMAFDRRSSLHYHAEAILARLEADHG